MARKIVAIVGSYRKGGTVDTLADAVLAGAHECGAELSKIYLIDKRIEYCRNCRTCTQEPGASRGECAITDDMQPIIADVESADAVVLASPVNFYNTTAVFRTFLERLLGAAYWPWGAWSPKPRSNNPQRKAVLIASSAAPGFLLPLMSGAPKALRVAAACLGARPVAKLWVGLAAQSAEVKMRERVLLHAHRIGNEL